jgi:prepilin-type N-terminal cleavage/methylation domain-containing protein
MPRTSPRIVGAARSNRFGWRVAFSLVELVIVVVIIGVIAAIAVPRVSKGAAGAGESALRSSLKSFRDAIDRYAAEHNGEFPGATTDGVNAAHTADAFINQLTQYTNAAGAFSSSPSASHPFGPYLRRIPPLPVGGNSGEPGIAIDAANSPPLVVVGVYGWVYNPDTGEFIANSDDPNHDGSLTFDEY